MAPTLVITALAIGLALSLAGAVYLWTAKRAAERSADARIAQLDTDRAAEREQARVAREQLQAELGALGHEFDGLRQNLTEQQVANGRLEEQLRGAEQAAVERQQDEQQRRQEERAQRAADEKRLKDAFDALAGAHLDKAGDQLLKRAAERFALQDKASQTELDKRKTAIDELVRPLREAMTQQQARLEQMRVEHGKAQATLHQRIADTLEASTRISDSADDLVRALKRPGVRGRWGELQLRRVVELAGMIEHCDFDEQASVTDDQDQRLRPDLVVRLPADRTIVIDAKTSLQAYLDAHEAESEAEQERHMARHVEQIEEQVKLLARKNYQAQFERSPDFVVLFIPGESFLQAAAGRDGQLMERAMNRGVLIASPMTLIALLKAVAMGWREQRLAESAEEIRKLGVEMHERFGVLSDKLEKLGRAVHNSVKSYNDVVGSFEGRLLVTARKFRELGADSHKELPSEGVSIRVDEPLRLPQAAGEAQPESPG
ncbi:MAG: DNA recombination protein RmuC [Planctomycetota bacterium]